VIQRPEKPNKLSAATPREERRQWLSAPAVQSTLPNITGHTHVVGFSVIDQIAPLQPSAKAERLWSK
jgi:hypothetical protein